MSQPPGQRYVTAILLAGGSGNRMLGQVSDKILAALSGKPAISYSIDAFIASEAINAFVVVHRDDAQRDAIEKLFSKSTVSINWVHGGAERKDSVWAGLQATPEQTEIVLIHDCARPCVTVQAITESIGAARQSGAACVAKPVTDTIKSTRATKSGYTLRTLDRSQLWAMETPQTFRFSLIRDAYKKIIAEGNLITDDLSAIEDQGISVAFIDNGRANPKLTTPQDIPYIEIVLKIQ